MLELNNFFFFFFFFNFINKFYLLFQHKCGSFLSRGKMLLNRIAVTVGESKDSIQGRAKNSRNFVFAAKSPEKETIAEKVRFLLFLLSNSE